MLECEGVLSIYKFLFYCGSLCLFFPQVLTQDQKSFSQKLSSYFSRLWNVADTFSMIIFVVAIIMRYVAWGTRNGYLLTGARVLLATDAIAFFTRSFQIFSASQHLGPKLVMIRKMVSNRCLFSSSPGTI